MIGKQDSLGNSAAAVEYENVHGGGIRVGSTANL